MSGWKFVRLKGGSVYRLSSEGVLLSGRKGPITTIDKHGQSWYRIKTDQLEKFRSYIEAEDDNTVIIPPVHS